MDEKTHAFVIRLWNEAEGDGTDPVTWRGYVDHVSSGVRCHLNNLEDILPFIAQQLHTTLPSDGTDAANAAGAVDA